ncbi:MAG: IS3 family transposase, partial [Carnobacterium sp.]|nr:IS3 family transposase [Carnobacterium sp.]
RLINKGRDTVLKVIRLSLKAGHRITRILKVLHIPRSTYYAYFKWQKSKRAIRREAIKKCLL